MKGRKVKKPRNWVAKHARKFNRSGRHEKALSRWRLRKQDVKECM